MGHWDKSEEKRSRHRAERGEKGRQVKKAKSKGKSSSLASLLNGRLTCTINLKLTCLEW